MHAIARARLGLGRIALVAALGLAAPRGARASELDASGETGSFSLHAPAEVLRDFCRTDSLGLLWLELPDGARYELVTSVTDPAIANPGDGAFHPFDEATVRAALAEVRYPLDRVGAQVLLLPDPRRDGFDSAAGPGLILLSPGTRPLSAEQQHAEFVHELGHVVQRALMPDSNREAWRTYRRLRGIEDTTRYSATAVHADRPHEIFAEDFRALFGGSLATASGSIENRSIVAPREVQGLRPFMLGLAGVAVPVPLAAEPNPSLGVIRFSRAGTAATSLDVFDAQGRRVATLAPTTVGGFVQWAWDGHDASGRPVGRGVFYARARDGAAGGARVSVVR